MANASKTEDSLNTDMGKWLHSAFSGGSFAYFLTMIDKADIIAEHQCMKAASVLFAVSLLLNGSWALSYYMYAPPHSVSKALNQYRLLRRLNTFSQWMFIFPVILVVYFVLSSSQIV